MTQPPEASSTTQRTPLSADEKTRAEVNFVPYVAQALAARGRFEVSADTLEQVEMFQNVARRVGGVLQRQVVCYANGEVVVIAFDPDEPSGAADRSAFANQG